MRPWRTKTYGKVILSFQVSLEHLEQSCPLQPGLQLHLLGRTHLPPFRHGDEHTAVNSKINKYTSTGELIYQNTTITFNGKKKSGSICANTAR